MLQNKIKELRTQLSITQRELADAVSTSQQQIQRIETGKVAAKLGLAQAICSVLNKPLSFVFPVSDEMVKNCRSKSVESDENLQKLAASGIEMERGLWTVKLWLRGQDDFLWLSICPADKRRFRAHFQEKTNPDSERFFVFDSDQYRYALNAREVEFHQFLFEPLALISDDEDANEKVDYYNVNITLKNGGPVIALSVEPDEPEDEETGNIGQLNALFDMLECDPEPTIRYLITDADGEDAFIRIGSIAMLQVALDVVEPAEENTL